MEYCQQKLFITDIINEVVVYPLLNGTQREKKMITNVWDKTIPSEKSAYVRDNESILINAENFELEVNKLKMIDLFCGAGGFAVGCAWAGFQSVFGVDHFEPAMRTWTRNHPHAIGCLGDIYKIDATKINNLLKNKGVNEVDLITGGVPCQGFSIANRKHNDNDERNFLFLEYMRFVKEFNPKCIILENVSGMTHAAGGKFRKEIEDYMKALGYDTDVRLVNSAEYGVPQIRKRLIFLGIKHSLGIKCKIPDGNFKEDYRTVADAISDLPKLGNHDSVSKYRKCKLTAYQQLMRGQGDIEEIPASDRLYNHVSPNHPQETINKIANTQPGQPMYAKFKQRIRLRYDLPSPTQLAGGIRPQFQFGHPEQNRGLTIRERARIQSFPDSYVFEGGIVQERVQTGNAVPPLLVYHIARYLAEQLKYL
ncbi:MAG: DNA cytosine methyltransferase [Synergistaceae bacterium]|nr:DNA cytosine methyltransferase [Candidatus Equadaptatus faecalis]